MWDPGAAANMITYHPPISQIWGHQVGRLKAELIVERSLQFLEEKCSSETHTPAELSIGWTPEKQPAVTASVEAIKGRLGDNSNIVELPDAAGLLFRNLRWNVSETQLPSVALWFDSIARPLKKIEVVAHLSMLWKPDWKDQVPVPRPEHHWSGNMFGVHLGRPHRLTTYFAFRDIPHYLTIKKYLAEIGLVVLSDTHVRPKGSIAVPSWRKK
jgi:hypothetical protein